VERKIESMKILVMTNETSNAVFLSDVVSNGIYICDNLTGT